MRFIAILLFCSLQGLFAKGNFDKNNTKILEGFPLWIRNSFHL